MDTNRESLAQALAGEAVFSRLAATEVSALARSGLRRDYERDQFVLLEGEIWPYVMYLASGTLAWSLTRSDGRRQMLIDVARGSVVWGHSLFDDLPMPADLQAAEAAVTYRWDRETIRPVLADNPDAMWEVCRQLVDAMRRVRGVVFAFAFQTAAQRLANLLLRWYEGAEGERVRRERTLEEMAAYVGTTPAVACKALYGFADQGILRVSRTELEFLDLPALRQLAGADPCTAARQGTGTVGKKRATAREDQSRQGVAGR